jgi:hypothetical protein
MDYNPRGTRSFGCLKLCWKDSNLDDDDDGDHELYGHDL